MNRLAKGLGLAGFTVALAVFLWGVSRGWSLPITDSHNFRQAQTAIMAQMLHEDGIPPLTPFNGLGPPWNVPMEFPFYQLLVSLAAHLTGHDIVAAGRLLAVVGSLLVVAWLAWLLRRHALAENVWPLLLIPLLTSPLWVHYSRAVLIETWATGLTLAWLGALLHLLRAPAPSVPAQVFTGLIGVLAAVTKVTTFATHLPAALLVTILCARRRQLRTWAVSGLATAPAIAAALLWTRWTDAQKALHPYAEFLTSAALSDWNWGTLAQRLDPAWWDRLFEYVGSIVPLWSLALVPLGLLAARPAARWTLFACVLTALTGPLAFANLYFIHNYYYLAIAPAVTVGVALGAHAVGQRLVGPLDRIRRAAWKTAAGALVTTALLTTVGIVNVQHYRAELGEAQVYPQPPPALALALRALTSPDDTIAVIGGAWEPLLAFYAQRPMATLRLDRETDQYAWDASRRALAPRDYTVLVARHHVADDLRFVALRARELGLPVEPVASLPEADIYLRPEGRQDLADTLRRLRAEGLILPGPPPRTPPAISRSVFLEADWRPVPTAWRDDLFARISPQPDRYFAMTEPVTWYIDGHAVLHLHPIAALRFAAAPEPRALTLDYGVMPEIWEKEHPSDGVRFQVYLRHPDRGERLSWQAVLRPRWVPTDRGTQHSVVAIPAGHEFELRIDGGPANDLGYDWAYLDRLTLTPAP